MGSGGRSGGVAGLAVGRGRGLSAGQRRSAGSLAQASLWAMLQAGNVLLPAGAQTVWFWSRINHAAA